VRPEERVIVSLPDGPDFVAALFGVIRRGSVVVMVNPEAPPDLLRYFLEYTRATAAFIAGDRVGAFSQASDGLAPVPRTHVVDTIGFSNRVRAGPTAFVPFDSHRDDPAMWLFSGGTTGRPKAVVQTHRSYVNTTILYGQRALGIRADDITISVP